jgi:uncharacterized protein (UPF0333 family)
MVYVLILVVLAAAGAIWYLHVGKTTAVAKGKAALDALERAAAAAEADAKAAATAELAKLKAKL